MRAASPARAGAVTLSVLALSACGAMSTGNGSDNDFLDESPRAMSKTAMSEMRELQAVRILGSSTTKLGWTRVDVRLDDTHCVGRLQTQHGVIRIIKNPDGAWFQADEDFWRSQAPSPREADRVAAAYGDSWVVLEGKDQFLDMCDLDAILDEITFTKKDNEDTTDAEVVLIGDAEAVPIHGRDGKDRVTVWVAVEAPHRLLKMAPTEKTWKPEALFFSGFDVDVTAESPPEDDIVSPSS